MADKAKEQDGQEIRPTEQQTVFPKSAAEDAGLPPNVADPSAEVHKERGLEPPYPGDGTNTGMVHPRIDDPPGVTGIDRGTDPSVPSFIPDLVGPRTDADFAQPTQEERDAEAEQLAKDAAKQVEAGKRASDKAKDKK